MKTLSFLFCLVIFFFNNSEKRLYNGIMKNPRTKLFSYQVSGNLNQSFKNDSVVEGLLKKRFTYFEFKCPFHTDTMFNFYGRTSVRFKQDSVFFNKYIKSYLLKNKVISLENFVITKENPINTFFRFGYTYIDGKIFLMVLETSRKYGRRMHLMRLDTALNIESHVILFSNSIDAWSEVVMSKIDCEGNIFQNTYITDIYKDATWKSDVTEKYFMINDKDGQINLISQSKHRAIVDLVKGGVPHLQEKQRIVK